jgi:glycosidase
MALDKYYGDPIQFKAFVNAAHEMGIAVILDVVYNHAFGQSPLSRLYWDPVNNRPAPNNPWLNPEARHPFNVGFDFNHESIFTKSFVKQISTYWLEEFHIDGFRFDLSKGFTQKNNPDNVGAWSNYDASRIAIWKDYGDFIWSKEPDALLILEHFADNNEEKELSDYGFMLWGNGNASFNEATMGYHDDGKSNFDGMLHSLRGWSKPHLVGFMESHDEERLMYKNLAFGNSSGDYVVKDLSVALARQKLVNTFYWMMPGPKMIWQFGELGYEFSINQCQNGMITENCRLDKKPIRWDYAKMEERKSLYRHISNLIAIRDSFDLGTAEAVKQALSGSLKKLEIQKGEHIFLAIGNFDVEELTMNVDFANSGPWYELFTKETLDYDAATISIVLKPGEYRLYSNRNFELPTSVNTLLKSEDITIYPNPADEVLNILPTRDLRIKKVSIIDVSGREFLNQDFRQSQIIIKHLPKGIYIVQLLTNEGMAIKKIVIN